MDRESIFLYSHPKWRCKTIALRTELLTCSSLQQGLGARSFGWKDTPFLWQSEGTCRLVVFELWWPVIKEKSMDITWISKYGCPVAWQCQHPQIKHFSMVLSLLAKVKIIMLTLRYHSGMMFTNTFQLPNHSSLLELPIKNDVYEYFQIPKAYSSLLRTMFTNTFKPPDWRVTPIVFTVWSASKYTIH